MTRFSPISRLQSKKNSPTAWKRVPPLVIPRLSVYYRVLNDVGVEGIISSDVISQVTGFSAAQVRRDLAFFGQFGVPGRGYDVGALRSRLSSILGIDQIWNVAICGVGNLGRALAGYKGFAKQGLRVVAAFEVDRKKIGKSYHGIKIYPLKKMKEVVSEKNIKMAIVTVPSEYGQALVDKIIAAGIKLILNFAPVRLKVARDIKLHNIDIAMEMEQLSFWAKLEN